MSQFGVLIVMATFNGAKWLPEQLSSIQSQGYQHWNLLISDDGSTDGTIEIIQRAVGKDERIKLLPVRGGNAGHVANFEYLLEHALGSGADYVFLADQDDVWMPQKLEVLLALAGEGRNRPMVVFSDMERVDSTGGPLGNFMAAQGSTGAFGVDELLRQNYLAGCSLLVNAQLLKLALPFPDNLENHDWWLGICAAAFSCVGFCPEKLVHYRQHSGNTIGSKNILTQIFNFWSIIKRQRRVFESKIAAIGELSRRLQKRGANVPASLDVYCRNFEGVKGWRRPLALVSSEFKPSSTVLYLAQLLALSPFVKKY